MLFIPKETGPKVKERCVRQVLEHLPEYPSMTAAAEVVARREGLGKETVRRWVVQAQIEGGQCQGATSEELARSRSSRPRSSASRRTMRSSAGEAVARIDPSFCVAQRCHRRLSRNTRGVAYS